MNEAGDRIPSDIWEIGQTKLIVALGRGRREKGDYSLLVPTNSVYRGVKVRRFDLEEKGDEKSR